MTDTPLPSARTKLARELEQFPAYMFTPMTKEEYERSKAIADTLLDEVFGDKENGWLC